MTMGRSADSAMLQLEWADRTRDDAVFLLEDERFRSAASRAYYSMFQAARAALETTGTSRPRSHGAVANQIGFHFVRMGIVDRKFSERLREAYRLRWASDYEIVFPYSNRSVAEVVANAEAFIAEMRRVTESALANRPDAI